MAAGAVAWLLLWAAWLVGRLAADFSDAPFSAGKGQGAERVCAELGRRWGAPAAPGVPEAGGS
uniref:Phosphatidylinositol glycan anchor biosynthesis, class X n=1 Tax=Mus musculus TaxID=10090 RepID=F7CUX5_MOUSE